MSATPSVAISRRTYLVGWHGADFEFARAFAAAGLMPVFARLIQEGPSGPLLGFAPHQPSMLWGTVATGELPDRHGITAPIVGDEKGLRPTETSDWRSPSIWSRLAAAGKKAAVVGWPHTYPVESLADGLVVSDAWLREQPEEATLTRGIYPASAAGRFGSVRVGRSTIDARLLGLFMPRLSEIDRRRDLRPAVWLAHLAHTYSVHNAAVLASRGGPEFLAVHYPLIEAANQIFLAFHRPKLPGAPVRMVELYDEVLTGAYRLLDRLLGDLLCNAPADTTLLLVSPCGVVGDDRRSPLPHHVQHHAQGFIAGFGPAIEKGKTRMPARVEDVATLILSWHGVAAETVPTPSKVAPLDEQEKTILKRQLRDFCLVDPAVLQSKLPPTTLAHVEWTQQFHVGRALMERDESERALLFLHRAWWREPEDMGAAFHLALALLRAGLREEARTPWATLEDFGPAHPKACFFRAQLSLRAGLFREALETARVARTDPGLARQAATLERTALVFLRRFDEAEPSLREVIAQEPRNAWAHAGLALVNYLRRNHVAARECASNALRISPDNPLATQILTKLKTRSRRREPVSMSELMTHAADLARLREEYHAREEAWAAESFGSTLDPKLIVTGVPCAGTSLLMRMLSMAGAPVLTDGVHPPDEYNPSGYFAWSAAEALQTDPSILATAAGRVVKLPPAHLDALPGGVRSKIIVVTREPAGLAASRLRWSRCTGAQPLATAHEAIAQEEMMLQQTLRRLTRSEVLQVPFQLLLNRDSETLNQVAAFVGADMLPRPHFMKMAVRGKPADAA